MRGDDAAGQANSCVAGDGECLDIDSDRPLPHIKSHLALSSALSGHDMELAGRDTVGRNTMRHPHVYIHIQCELLWI